MEAGGTGRDGASVDVELGAGGTGREAEDPAGVTVYFDLGSPYAYLSAERISLRVFCHAYGNRRVLLLHGYDKGEDTSAKRQDKEIAIARKRLKDWQNRQRRRPG